MAICLGVDGIFMECHDNQIKHYVMVQLNGL